MHNLYLFESLHIMLGLFRVKICCGWCFMLFLLDTYNLFSSILWCFLKIVLSCLWIIALYKLLQYSYHAAETMFTLEYLITSNLVHLADDLFTYLNASHGTSSWIDQLVYTNNAYSLVETCTFNRTYYLWSSPYDWKYFDERHSSSSIELTELGLLCSENLAFKYLPVWCQLVQRYPNI